MMQPVLCETLDDSQTLKGNEFRFPAIPWSCTAKNVQLAVSRFAFCCNVILFLTGESSQLSLIGVLMVLCQSPCAQPRAKKLRESFEFNNSVNHRGNDKTWLTPVGCAAGPMQHLQKTQVCVQNFGFLLLQVHMSNPAAFAQFRHATPLSRLTKAHRRNKTDTGQEANLINTQFAPMMLEKFGSRINAGSPAVSFHGVSYCGSSAFSEVKGIEQNVSISTALVSVRRNSVAGRRRSGSQRRREFCTSFSLSEGSEPSDSRRAAGLL